MSDFNNQFNFQILIKVAVAAVNPTDTWCRDGAYPEWSMKLYVPSFPWTPGRDVAGTVEKIGSKVIRVKVSILKETLIISTLHCGMADCQLNSFGKVVMVKPTGCLINSDFSQKDNKPREMPMFFVI